MSDEGKLFVGGLSFDTTEDGLEEAFSKYGTITKVDVIRDRDTGGSRGFGFVTFANPEDAKDALEGMNGKSLEGRSIRVDEAGKSGSRSGGFRARGGGGGRGFYQGASRGGRGGGYSGGDRSYDRGYGDRSYGSGGYSGGYSTQRNSGGGRYSGGSSGGGGGGGGGYYRDRESYGEQRSSGSYRDSYDYPNE